jgi:hypothetical protein
MKRVSNNTKTFQSCGSYHTKQIQLTKNEIVTTIQHYNDRKSSKEETLNDLQLLINKIDGKLKSFRPN